jgi:hypothetical protein
LRPAAAQDQVQVLAVWSGFGNWILRYNTAVIFHIYIQLCARDHAVSQLQDFRKAIRSKPVIGVIADVRLQHDFLFFSGQSATIDEIPDHMPNLSDMGVCGDVIPNWQHESRKPPRICFERIL